MPVLAHNMFYQGLGLPELRSRARLGITERKRSECACLCRAVRVCTVAPRSVAEGGGRPTSCGTAFPACISISDQRILHSCSKTAVGLERITWAAALAQVRNSAQHRHTGLLHACVTRNIRCAACIMLVAYVLSLPASRTRTTPISATSPSMLDFGTFLRARRPFRRCRRLAPSVGGSRQASSLLKYTPALGGRRREKILGLRG